MNAAMTTNHRHSTSERAGGAFARAVTRVRRVEMSFEAALVAAGVSVTLAHVAVWILRAVVVVAAFFWLPFAAVLVGAVALLCIFGAVELPPYEAPEWRQGYQGFGLYEKDGTRIDPHNPNDPNDIN
jgi:hypothetical protein